MPIALSSLFIPSSSCAMSFPQKQESILFPILSVISTEGRNPFFLSSPLSFRPKGEIFSLAITDISVEDSFDMTNAAFSFIQNSKFKIQNSFLLCHFDRREKSFPPCSHFFLCPIVFLLLPFSFPYPIILN